MRVTLSIQDGPMKGQEKVFDEADIFIVGRMEDCHYSLNDDPYLSRHHFMLEINPPEVFIRDLGSLNGTFVNGEKFGGRSASESPEKAGRRGEELELKDGDLIKCGYTEMKVVISAGDEPPKSEMDFGEKSPSDAAAGSDEPPDAKTAEPDGKKEEAVSVPSQSPARMEEPSPATSATPDKEKAPPAAMQSPKPAAAAVAPQPSPAIRVPDPVKESPAVSPKPSPPKPFIPKPFPPKPANRPPAFKSAAPPDAPAGALVEALIKRLLLNAAGAAQQKLPEIKGYRILKKLGEGGFGAVYLGEREKGKKMFALKTMLQQKEPTQKGIAMFEREIEVNRKLRHRNIIHVEDYFVTGDLHFFALEYMDGGSLWELMLQKGKLDMDEAAPIMLQSLDGLAYAHKKKIIHRDIKPPNILFSGDPKKRVVKLSDFGLAKNFAKAGMTKTNITVAGAVCGSPPYMAPEHITNYRFVKPPTDVFEIAATFYHMLTGRVVWNPSGGGNVYQAILQGSILPVAALDSNVPRAARAVIDQALNRDPAKRFEDGGAMLKAMKKAL